MSVCFSLLIDVLCVWHVFVVCVHVFVQVFLNACLCKWSPKVEVRYPSRLFSSSLFVAGSSKEPRAHWFGLAGPWVWGSLPALDSKARELLIQAIIPSCFPPYIVGLYYTGGLQTQALVYFIVDMIYMLFFWKNYIYSFVCMFVCAHVCMCMPTHVCL